MLNKFGPSGHGEAQVQYLDGDFRVISPGTYVRCAVTDARIPLDELKYWSVDLQEAYAVPTAVLQRHFPAALKVRRVGKGASAPCPPFSNLKLARNQLVGTLRFAHPTSWLPAEISSRAP